MMLDMANSKCTLAALSLGLESSAIIGGTLRYRMVVSLDFDTVLADPIATDNVQVGTTFGSRKVLMVDFTGVLRHPSKLQHYTTNLLCSSLYR